MMCECGFQRSLMGGRTELPGIRANRESSVRETSVRGRTSAHGGFCAKKSLPWESGRIRFAEEGREAGRRLKRSKVQLWVACVEKMFVL